MTHFMHHARVVQIIELWYLFRASKIVGYYYGKACFWWCECTIGFQNIMHHCLLPDISEWVIQYTSSILIQSYVWLEFYAMHPISKAILWFDAPFHPVLIIIVFNKRKGEVGSKYDCGVVIMCLLHFDVGNQQMHCSLGTTSISLQSCYVVYIGDALYLS